MASTRNKNSKDDYCIQQSAYKNGTSYNLYTHSQHGQPVNTMLPDFGLNSAKMGRFELNGNSVNIESQLFGIGSTNLVNPKSEISPAHIHVPHGSIHTFDNFTIMPEPLVIEKGQRPNKLN